MWKTLNKIIISIYIGIGIWYFYDQLSNQVYDRLLIGCAIIPVLLGPYLIKKLLKYEMCELLKFCYYVFALLGLILGSILGFYKFVPLYDKFTHFISGFITSLVALIFLKKAKLLNGKKTLWFNILFIICFSLTIASIWEFFEFICDKLLNADAQYVKTTGVDDTMLDMLVAFFGSILFSLYYFYQEKFANKSSIERIEKYL